MLQAIAQAAVATYKAELAGFSQWARRHGVDPTVLPVHPVVAAAWLATLAPLLGGNALRRRMRRSLGIVGASAVSGRLGTPPSARRWLASAACIQGRCDRRPRQGKTLDPSVEADRE